MTDFIGNTRVRKQLLTLAQEGRLHPCLLFEGPNGVGKNTFALWLAKWINCEDADRPCGTCWSCRQIPKGQHPDIIRIGLDTKKTAAIISVGQVRDLLGQLALRPFHAKHRLVIIDPADAMTPEAANALLKTLEEPPAETGFVLISSAAASLLSTVRSRSQRVRFAPVSVDEMTEWLEARGVEQPGQVARLAQGCPGRALSLTTTEKEDWRDARDALLTALEGRVDERFKYAETLTRGDRSAWQRRFETTLQAVSCMLRDTMACRQGGTIFYNDDRPEVVEAWASRVDTAGLARLAEDVATARSRLASFVNGRLLTDGLVARLDVEIGERR